MAPPDGSEPAPPGAGWSDHRVELILGTLLRTGVMTAALVVAVGGIRYLLHYGGARPAYGTFRGEPDDLTRLGGILSAAGALRGRGVIQLGLLLLIATPVARVAFSLFAFLRQRDLIYAAITAVVLLVLLLSLGGSGA